MNEQDPLRVAIIGYGLAGSVFHAPLVEATPGMHVAAIVTSNPERQANARAAYPRASVLSEVDAIWRDPGSYDAVVVASPNRSHVPLGLAAVEAGLPVVIDKPLAPSVSAARTLVQAARERNVPLTVFQNRRWDGDFRTVRTLIEAGTLGQIARYESRFERYRPVPKPGAWRELPDPEEGGGLLFDLGSHLIDQALVLFGRPTSVYAEVTIKRPGAQIDDDTFVALQYANGFHAHLWMNTVVRILAPRFHVSGLRGSYVKYGLDPQEDSLKAGLRPGQPGWGIEPREAWGRLSTEVENIHVDGQVETLAGQYELFYAQFASAVRGNGPLPVQPQESVASLEIIEAARQSAQRSQVIELTTGEEAVR